MDNDTVISISEEENEDDELNDSDSVDDDEWNDEEVLKRVIQLSKLESARENCEDQTENQDLKRALELSLQYEPLIESTGRPSSPEIPTVDLENEDSNDTKRGDPIDSSRSNKYLHEQIGGVFTDLANFESADSDDDSTSEKDNEQVIKLSSESDTAADDVVQDATETQSVIIEELIAPAPTSTSASFKPVEEVEEQSVILEDTLSRSFPPTPSTSTLDHSSDQLTSEEVTVRMRNIFESNLRVNSGEEMEACSAVRTKLFPHQRQALAWMMMRETSDQGRGVQGGILAEMLPAVDRFGGLMPSSSRELVV